MLLLAGMGRIPRELYEAARLDGAGPVREFFAVTLPSVRGEIAVALTLTVIAALRTFDLVYVTTRGGPGHETTVPSYEVYHQAFELGRVGSAARSASASPSSSSRSRVVDQPVRRQGGRLMGLERGAKRQLRHPVGVRRVRALPDPAS